MQPVSAFIQRLPLNRHRIAERDGRVLIRSGTPDLPIRDDFAPDLAPVRQRPVIVDRDIGDADTLRYSGMLTRSRQIQHQRLAGGSLGLSETSNEQNNR